MEYNLTLKENDYEIRTVTMEDTTICFRAFEDRIYVRRPVDPEYQKLNIYIPEGYYEGKTINGYTGKTVPIFFPNASGAYAAGPADKPGHNFRLWGRGKPNGIFYALAAGFVVVAPGTRGRTCKDEEGRFTGCAPAHIVDLKAAVRYIRYNKDKILGDTNRIISNGTSAGGALSALLGTSGNSREYESYLQKLGAAEERDDVYATSCYTPIMDLEHADMAYEWMFHGVNRYELHIVKKVDGELQESFIEGEMTPEQIAQSDLLIEKFAEYINKLRLTDEQGAALTLEKDGSGSFQDYVTKHLVASAQKALDNGADLSGMPWIAVKNDKITNLSLSAHAKYATRMKQLPAFDQWNLGSPENELFGTADNQFQHFTQYGYEHSVVGGEMADQHMVALMNPLTFANGAASQVCNHWRIRFGTLDRDTSMAVPVILANILKKSGGNVDYFMPWELPHSGDYDMDELFAWIRSICLISPLSCGNCPPANQSHMEVVS